MGLPPIKENNRFRRIKTPKEFFGFIAHPLFAVRFKTWHIKTTINIFYLKKQPASKIGEVPTRSQLG